MIPEEGSLQAGQDGLKPLGELTMLEKALRRPSIEGEEGHKTCNSLYMSTSIVGLVTLCCFVLFFSRHYIKEFILWLEGLNGGLGVILFVVLFTVVSFPMTWGYVVLNISAGYLYGFLEGLVIVILAVFQGTFVAHVMCKRFCGDFLLNKIGGNANLTAIARVLESNSGFKVIALSRLTPIPFGLQNGLFAVSKVQTFRYMTASTLGLLPTQALNTYIGSSLHSVEEVVDNPSSSDYMVLGTQVGVSVLLMVYVVKQARVQLNKALLQHQPNLSSGPTLTTYPKRLTSSQHTKDNLHLMEAAQHKRFSHDGDVSQHAEELQPANQSSDTEEFWVADERQQ
ncbi:transmembrane protein 64-like [Branchiostoma floridae x Branchiostoma japonicum]